MFVFKLVQLADQKYFISLLTEVILILSKQPLDSS